MRIFIPLFLIITSALIGYFNIKPLYEDVRAATLEKENFDEALGKTKEISIVVEKLAKKLDEIPSSDIDKLNVLLPSKADGIRFLNMLSSIASKSSISVSDAKLLDKKSENFDENIKPISGVSKISISFSVTTSYSTFKNFLKDIERSLVLIDVDSIKSSKAPALQGAPSNIYIYEVVLSTYMLD